MSGPSATQPDRNPVAASRRWDLGGTRDETIAKRRHQHRPKAPPLPSALFLTSCWRSATEGTRRAVTTQARATAHPARRSRLPAVALMLHTAVPPATDHPYRKHANPASTADDAHLVGRYGIDLGGQHAALKHLYLTVVSLDPTGGGRRRWTNRWKAALNAFDITFDGRVSAGRK
jgi:hypothetical protein